MSDRGISTLHRVLKIGATTSRTARLATLIAGGTGAEADSPALERELVRRVRAISRRRPLGRPWLRRALVAAKIRANTSKSARAIVVCWPKLTEPSRKAITSSIPEDLAAAVGDLVCDEDSDRRLVGVCALADLPGAVTPGAVVALASDEDDRVRAGVTRSLRVLSRRLAVDGASAVWMDETLAALADAAPALRDRDALAPILDRAARPGRSVGPRLARVLEDGGREAPMALRALMRRSSDLDGATLVRLLGVEALAPAALDLLSSGSDGELFFAGVRASHLLLAPDRRRWIARVDRARRLAPEPAALAAALAASPVDTARWVAALGRWRVASAPAGRLYDCWLADESAGAHAALAAHLSRAKRPAEPARSALEDLAFDRDPRAARSATLARSDERCDAGVAMMRRIVRSPHAGCRAIARDSLRRCDPYAPLEAPDPLLDAVSARGALARDRDAFVGRLRSVISAGAPARRVAAVGLAVRAEVARECELELLAAAGDRDARIAATAISALGHVGTDSARQALRSCLPHKDARVRANALEALDRIGLADEPAAERIISPAPRERGNAVRTLAHHVEPKLRAVGLEALDAMLGDERPAHRASALWLVERLGWIDAARRVAELAARDEAPPVRQRARRTARRLLGLMRAGAGPALTLDAERAQPMQVE